MNVTFNEDFVAKYKSSFTEQVLSNAFESVSSMSGKDLVNITPCKQLNFFILKDLFTKWQGEMKALESPYFNFKAPEVRKAMTQFMNTLSRHIEVDRDALGPLIENALEDCILISIQPAAFIKKELLDRSSQEYSLKHVKPLLKYIKVLNEEFDDFFEAQANGTYEDVFEIATDYFADVDLTQAQDAIISELSQLQQIEMSDLLVPDELEDVIAFDEDELDEEETTSSKAEPMVVEEELTEDPKEQEIDQEIESVQEETITEEKEDPVVEEGVPDDLEESDELISTEEASSEIPPSDTSESSDSTEPGETLNDQFTNDTEQTVAEHLEETQAVDGMLASISLNQQYMFAQELYGGDANAFQSSINTIDNIGSFDDAVEHLVTNYAKKFDWDMNSDEVKELLKIIFRKFR